MRRPVDGLYNPFERGLLTQLHSRRRMHPNVDLVDTDNAEENRVEFTTYGAPDDALAIDCDRRLAYDANFPVRNVCSEHVFADFNAFGVGSDAKTSGCEYGRIERSLQMAANFIAAGIINRCPYHGQNRDDCDAKCKRHITALVA